MDIRRVLPKPEVSKICSALVTGSCALSRCKGRSNQVDSARLATVISAGCDIKGGITGKWEEAKSGVYIDCHTVCWV